MSFTFRHQSLFCEQLRVQEIREQVQHTPFYLYSAAQLQKNVLAYCSALDHNPANPGRLNFALKANNNLSLLRSLHENDCGATTVSGNEIQLALAAGFRPENILFNGNGKTPAELAMAIDLGIMVNVDSEFDLLQIGRAAETANRPVTVLLRLNPDIDPQVHPHNATGRATSKFGIPPDRIPWFLDHLKSMPLVQLAGLHCHLGSTITRVSVFREATRIMAGHMTTLIRQGFPLHILNMGGGLGIADRPGTSAPTPADLVTAIQDLLPPQVTLILEPGRSIVGNAGILVCTVLGVKDTGREQFIVTDGSMAELIRPSLYNAYHDIAFLTPVTGAETGYNIVGPVCESGDFLGKDRRLPAPPAGTGLAVFNAGAYGYAMSSNYNARLRPAEYLVNGHTLTQIRRPEQLSDLLNPMLMG